MTVIVTMLKMALGIREKGRSRSRHVMTAVMRCLSTRSRLNPTRLMMTASILNLLQPIRVSNPPTLDKYVYILLYLFISCEQ